MKCGYCKKEMLEGYITTPSIEWHPKYGKNKLFYKGEKKDGFRLGKFSCLNQKEQLAWYCEKVDFDGIGIYDWGCHVDVRDNGESPNYYRW